MMFSGLYPVRMASSEDDGKNWTPLEKVGDFGGIVALGSVVSKRRGLGTIWLGFMTMVAISRKNRPQKNRWNSPCTK